MDAINTFMLVVILFHQGATSHPARVYEPPEDAAVIDVYVSARRSLKNHNDAAASQAFLWLWDHALKRDPAAQAVRAAAARHLGELAERYEPTRAAVIQRRDRLQRMIDAEPQSMPLQKLRDWATLNEAMGDEHRIISWWEKIKDKAEEPQMSAVAAGMEPYLQPLLQEELRWSELAKLYPDPKEYVGRHIEMHRRLLETYRGDEGLEMLPADMRERTKRERVQRAWEDFRNDIAVVYASLLVADREREASEVAELAVKADESDTTMRLTLVDMAIGAGEGRAEHAKWIDEAEQQPSLKEKARQLRVWLHENLKE